jgi:hypothetical protein
MKDDKKPSQQMKVNINLYWKYQGIHGCIVIENIMQKIQLENEKNGSDHQFESISRPYF